MVSDQKVLCAHTYAEREGRNLSGDCGETLVKYGLLGISIQAINLKEQCSATSRQATLAAVAILVAPRR